MAVGVGVTHAIALRSGLCRRKASNFGLPFIDLGLVPEAASTYLLPRILGYPRASELLLLGEAFSAETAREHGIVNAVVAADELQGLSWSKAVQLAAKPPEALRQTKALLKRALPWLCKRQYMRNRR